MQQRYNIFYIIFSMLFVFFSSCSENKNVIPQKTMSAIISEMYLADKYIENIPEYRAQMDSLYLYEAVTARHGYTYNDYHTSVKYYLQKGDALKKMHKKAKELLTQRQDRLNEIMTKEQGMEIDFWALDSLAEMDLNTLWKEPYLRTLQWLSMYSEAKQPESWRFTDTTAADIPQNPVWWINNIRLQSADYIDSIYPPLLKDYRIAKENDNAKNGNLPGKDSNAKKMIPAKQIKELTHKNKPDAKSPNKRRRPAGETFMVQPFK